MLEIKAVTQEGEELNIIRQLFRDYEKELEENLCFQSFEEELKEPLKKYGPPNGALFLAYGNNEVAGCIALYDLGEKVCEMKRLYVKSVYREHKIGRALIELLLQKAKELGYNVMKLDTLQKLQAAIHLYKKYGFTETTSYYNNPLPGVVYMEKKL
jgi:N-acetylglutamate synthase-like GNAT family acetyltransferase